MTTRFGTLAPASATQDSMAKSVLVGYDYEQEQSVTLSDAVRARLSGSQALA